MASASAEPTSPSGGTSPSRLNFGIGRSYNSLDDQPSKNIVSLDSSPKGKKPSVVSLDSTPKAPKPSVVSGSAGVESTPNSELAPSLIVHFGDDPASDWEKDLDSPTLDKHLRDRIATWGQGMPMEKVQSRRTILDEDRMFSSITVRFHETWERDTEDTAGHLRREECELTVRRFITEYCIKHKELAKKRWKTIEISEDGVMAAMESELSVYHLREGTWHTLTFHFQPSARIHRILWSIGDELLLSTFYESLQEELGPEYKVTSSFFALSWVHLCYVAMWLLFFLLLAEAAFAAAGDVGNDKRTFLEWSSRMWLIGGTIFELVCLTIVFGFPIRDSANPYTRELCVVAVYSGIGLKAIKVLPLALCLALAAVILQIHALDAWLTPQGIILGLVALASCVVSVGAFNTLRCKHPDSHSPLVIMTLTMLLLMLLGCCIWLFAAGEQDGGCFSVYLVCTVGVIASVQKYLKYGNSFQYDLAGFAEWRMIFLAGGCIFILGISNAPTTLLAYQSCTYDSDMRLHKYDCGAWKAGLVVVLFGVHGSFMSLFK